jgi:hypothetical protein
MPLHGSLNLPLHGGYLLEPDGRADYGDSVELGPFIP